VVVASSATTTTGNAGEPGHDGRPGPAVSEAASDPALGGADGDDRDEDPEVADAGDEVPVDPDVIPDVTSTSSSRGSTASTRPVTPPSGVLVPAWSAVPVVVAGAGHGGYLPAGAEDGGPT